MPDPAERVLALERRWTDCYRDADADGLAELMDDRFVHVSARGTWDRAACLEALASGAVEVVSLEERELRIVLHGSVALCIGTSELEASYAGMDIGGRDRFIRVWVEKGGAWKAISMQVSTIADDE